MEGIGRPDDGQARRNEAQQTGPQPRPLLHVISLPGEHARKQRMRLILESSPLAWCFHDAERDLPSTLHRDESSQRRELRRLLIAPEYGLYASHLAIIRDIAADAGRELHVVCEDDVYFDWAFDWRGLTADWGPSAEYIRLYTRSWPASKFVARVGHRAIVRFLRMPHGTQAYAISPSAARQFISYVDAYLGGRVQRPIDDDLDRFWIHGLLPYGLYPFPIMELQTPSTISTSENFYSPVFRDSFRRRLGNLIAKCGRFVTNVMARRRDAVVIDSVRKFL